MAFIADDLGAWLVGLLADAGRRKLTTLVLGSDQERALRIAATAAVRATAESLRPGGGQEADELALVVSQVFSQPVPAEPAGDKGTMLEGLQAGITTQLTVLDDADLTGTGQSSAETLGVSAMIIARTLTSHLVREIVTHGSRGGALSPLANHLTHDAAYLQGQRLEGALAELTGDVRQALAKLGDGSNVKSSEESLPQTGIAAAGNAGASPSAADRLHAVAEAILAHLVPASRPGPRGKLPLAVELALCRAVDEFGRSAGKASLTWPLLAPGGFLASREIAAILARALTGGYREGAPALGRAWARAFLDGTRADELTADAENLLGYLWAQAQNLRPLADLAGSLVAQAPAAPDASPAAAPWAAARERPPLVSEKELRMRLALAHEHIADFDRVAAFDIGRSVRSLPPELRFFLNDQTLLIAGASRDFVGREPVLEQVKAFIEGDEDGYCFVLARLGVGKTALLAHLVAGKPGYARHFNVLSEGVRTAEQFLNNVCTQLIGAYRLDPGLFPKSGNASTDLLRRLLKESAAKARGEKVVVVIDALDEAMTGTRLPGVNPLTLPRSLPEGCRFIVTVRDGTEGWEPALDVGCAARMLCVEVNSDENMNDARTYVRSRLASQGIARYLRKQNLSGEEFTDEVAARSEGYFVYLRHVLDQYDAGGELASRDLAGLPAGLTPYYDDQYERMRASTPQRQWEKVGLPVLIQLAIAEQPLTLYQLASSGAGRRKAAPVMATIEQWRQFLVKTSASWNGHQVPAYRLFHESFREFLKKKHEHAAGVAEVERALREDLGRQARDRYGRGGPSPL